MTFKDLEKRIAEITASPFREVCVWYKILNNPNSSTRYHTHKNHPLYPCYYSCPGTDKNKDCYRILEENLR